MNNIGIVTTWFERGASYVSKNFKELLEGNGSNVFIYARGGDHDVSNSEYWNEDNVTIGKRWGGTFISLSHIINWIESNRINILFFNEQTDMLIVAQIKRKLPKLKIGTYVDYYTMDTIPHFKIYDFIITNTLRHYQVFKALEQVYYIPWGTDVNVYKPRVIERSNNEVIFFHSAGMSDRKGTQILLDSFIKYKIYLSAKLVIHAQKKINKITSYSKEELEMIGIEVIEKTVSAPGLYHRGDVYVYPTKLDGLGLTIYEALSCGLPVIATDVAPMTDIIKPEENIGKLVRVESTYCRSDGYYWPMTDCSVEDLAIKMQFYIDNIQDLDYYKSCARNYAVQNLNWNDRKQVISSIFFESRALDFDHITYNNIRLYSRRIRFKQLYHSLKLYKFRWFIDKILP
ncbi:MAG: glycosyltransferase family 4 protein [Tissierellia bacterium]|nr:glycosyltransferase family 4 protein [Tissierellia bacterium]